MSVVYVILIVIFSVSVLGWGGTAWIMAIKSKNEEDPEKELLWYLNDRTKRIVELKNYIKSYPKKKAEIEENIKDINDEMNEIRKKYYPKIKARRIRDKRVIAIELTCAGVTILSAIVFRILLK